MNYNLNRPEDMTLVLKNAPFGDGARWAGDMGLFQKAPCRLSSLKIQAQGTFLLTA